MLWTIFLIVVTLALLPLALQVFVELLPLLIVGSMWLIGVGVCIGLVVLVITEVQKQETKSPLSIISQAAEQGNSDAQARLGFWYENGVQKNYAAAMEWYQKSAAQGNGVAEWRLAVMYDEGRGVVADKSAAMSLYQEAAEHGIAPAQATLGGSYLAGIDVPKDYAQALKWCGMAAAQDRPDAQRCMGYLFEHGEVVKLDRTAAAQWYERAAERGDAIAQFQLGIMYVNGHGVSTDISKAALWLSLAAAKENTKWFAQYPPGDFHRPDAALADLTTRLTPKQAAEAQRLIATWTPTPF